jgi:hypothetical protein
VLRNIVSIAFVLSIFAGAASAQTCSGTPITNNLTNGSTADATQVMANFTYVINCIGALRGYLGGLTMSNDTNNPSTVIDTSAGVADSDDVTTMMTLPAFTKNANATWAAGSGSGCLDVNSGTVLAASTWYHLYVIENTTTGVVDEVCTTSMAVPPSPTLPTGYNKKRRIGSFKTNSSSAILLFTQNGDEFLWTTEVADVNAAPIGNTVLSPVLSVPPGFFVSALLKVGISSSTGAELYAFPYGVSPTDGVVSTFGNASWPSIVPLTIEVPSYASPSRSIFVVATAASCCSYSIITRGWIDTRGRFN